MHLSIIKALGRHEPRFITYNLNNVLLHFRRDIDGSCTVRGYIPNKQENNVMIRVNALNFYGSVGRFFFQYFLKVSKICFSKEESFDDEDDMVLLRLSASIRAVGGGKHLRAICSLGDLI